MFAQIGQYALRIMAVLARETAGKTLRAKDLAPMTGIPPAYVSKVLQRLTEAGLLISQRGHRGGFQLARVPEKIRLVDILSAVGSDPAGQVCAFGWGTCNPDDPCPLHPVWNKLSTGVVDWAESTTLADVVVNPAASIR